MSTPHDHLPRTSSDDLSTIEGIDARGTVPHPHEDVVEQGHVKAPDDTDHPALHDLQQETPTAFVPQSRQDERLPQKRGLTTRAKMAFGGAVASAVAIAGTAAGAAIYSMNKNVENTIDDTFPDQNTSAPQTPGEEEPSTVALDPPEWEAFNFPYEEAVKPAQLTDEQLAAWNSGDAQVQNEIADQVLRDRTSYALTDIQRTQGTGQTPDISYVTHDPAVVEKLNWAVSQLPQASEVNGISVCPLDASDYGFAQMCYPSHLETPVSFVPEPGGSAVIYVNVIDDENTFGENPDLFKGFELDIHPEVDAEGVLTWVHN